MTFQTLIRIARAWFGLGGARSIDEAEPLFPSNIEVPDKPLYDAFTRIYNFLGAFIGVILLSPLMITIGIAVKLTSPGPAFYRGPRVGRNEVLFHIFKFRTMKVGSEQKIGKRLVKQSENHYTSIGKFLRKYRLDELAQLFNVLRGDMNLVGARPMRPIFLEDLKETVPGYARRFMIRPGITGQAQVRGGYYTHPRHKLFYEMLYASRRSVLLDLQLIALTFLRVMTKIFTTGFLLAWLLLMALVFPAHLRDNFLIQIGGVEFNVLYLAPTLITVAHILRRSTDKGKLYALRSPVDLPLLGFLIVTAALIPFSRFPMTSLRGFLWYMSNGVVVYYLVLNSRLATNRRNTLIYSLIFLVSLVGLGSIIDMLYIAGTQGNFQRLAGTFDGPLTLATIVVIALPLAVAKFRQARAHWRRVLFFAAVLTLSATATLTLSRSGILATTIALGLYFWRVSIRRTITVFALMAALVLSFWIAGDQRMKPAQALTDLNAAAQRQMLVLENITPKRLMVGVGARTLPDHIREAQFQGIQGSTEAQKRAPAMENTYLTIFVDHGPLGLLFFLAFLLGGISFMVRTAPTILDPTARDDLRATAAALIGCALLFAFSDALYHFPVMIVFWSTMGLGMGIALTARPGPRNVYRIVHFRHQL